MKNSALKESNPITTKLSDSLNDFLMDLAQGYVDGLTYNLIMNHEYSEEDIRKIRNLKRRCDYYYGDEDYIIEKVVPQIKKIFGISENLKESTPLANRFVAWYDDFANHHPINYLKRSEEIIGKYLGSKMYEMYIDEAVDALPLEGKAEIYDFLNQMEMLDE